MPTKLNASRLGLPELNESNGPYFLVRIQVCPSSGLVELTSVAATNAPPSPDACAPSERLYVLPMFGHHGRLFQVYVLAGISERGAPQPAPALPAPACGPSRRPMPPGLCGGVIAVADQTDELEMASQETRERVTREYSALLQRLQLSSNLRAAHH